MRYTLLITLLAASLAGCGGSGGSDPPPEPDIQIISDMPVAGVIDSADNLEQLFGFEAQSDGVYNVLLNWPDAASDLDLFVTDGVNTYVTLGDSGTVESINVAMAAGDILAIAVSAFGGTPNGPQDFTIAATATTQPAHSPGHVESEPNNDVPTGNIIGLGQVSGIVSYDFASSSGADPNDYFVYLAPGAATYTVLLTWTGTQHDLDLFIGSDAGTDFSAAANTDFESITLFLDVAEQLRIFVNAYDTNGIPVSYNLTVTAQ